MTMINYGFACKTVGVPGTAQHSIKLANADHERLQMVSRSTLNALKAMLAYCHKQDIRVLRISSDIIPFASHPEIDFDWFDLLKSEIKELGAYIKKTGIRVSMHPGQYTVLNSPRIEVAERAIEDLKFHARFLDALDADSSAVFILHVGGVYNDRKAALKRFKERFALLPEYVTKRMTIENDEFSYNIQEVVELCEDLGVPALFDVFHHSINFPAEGSMLHWLGRSGETWLKRGCRQKIHYSQQLAGAKAGMHSHSIGLANFLEFHRQLNGYSLDVMLEVKDKNLSAVKCSNLASESLPRARLTEEWAKYKYAVLERDPTAYNDIREYLKSASPQATGFYKILEAALAKEVTPGNAVNAAAHVWGYFSDLAGQNEKKRFLVMLDNLASSVHLLPSIKKFLFRQAEKYQISYLLQSLYFYNV